MGTACSRPIIGKQPLRRTQGGTCVESSITQGGRRSEQRRQALENGIDDSGEEETSRPLRGGSRCLDAMTIALCQAFGTRKEKRRWYVSTLELQLASLGFCSLCRSAPTLHLRIDNDTPHTLWAPRKGEPDQQSQQHMPPSPGSCSSSHAAANAFGTTRTRVPVIQAARVTWRRGGKDLVESGAMQHWPCVDTLSLEAGGSWSELESVALPPSLHRLVIELSIEIPLQAVVWPAHLEQLSIGFSVNTPIAGVVWPASLQELQFGDAFDQSIADVVWPISLQKMLFGYAFNQPIVAVVWPAHLRQLSFGKRFNQPITGVLWPAYLKELSFGRCFNQPIVGVVWPSSLQQLSFGIRFNQPITRVVWPSSLHQLSFGYYFNQPIAAVVWPASLQQLSFGYFFNQPVAGVLWPADLKDLSFGSCFNQPIAGVFWPACLQTLRFGNSFEQPIAGVVWPASLRSLFFGITFNQSTAGIMWPVSCDVYRQKMGFTRPYDYRIVRRLRRPTTAM